MGCEGPPEGAMQCSEGAMQCSVRSGWQQGEDLGDRGGAKVWSKASRRSVKGAIGGSGQSAREMDGVVGREPVGRG